MKSGSPALTLSVAPAQGLVHAVLVEVDGDDATAPQRLAVIIAPRPTGPHQSRHGIAGLGVAVENTHLKSGG